jgi:hypothetical protein
MLAPRSKLTGARAEIEPEQFLYDGGLSPYSRILRYNYQENSKARACKCDKDEVYTRGGVESRSDDYFKSNYSAGLKHGGFLSPAPNGGL